MVPYRDAELVNHNEFSRTRAELGSAFIRILGYFREDGVQSIDAIEQALRTGDAAALVRPAHTLKGESAQFGAHRLSMMAEHIEMTARRCVEARETPDELIEMAVALRPCFSATMTLLDQSASPLVARRAGFGRRVG